MNRLNKITLKLYPLELPTFVTQPNQKCQVLHSMVGSWPYPQTLDKACHRQTL